MHIDEYLHFQKAPVDNYKTLAAVKADNPGILFYMDQKCTGSGLSVFQSCLDGDGAMRFLGFDENGNPKIVTNRSTSEAHFSVTKM